jgi:hypothetical protein
MLRWLVLVALLCVGCMHPGVELIASPPASDPSTTQPSNTDTPSEEADKILRARFSTNASTAEVNRTACTLQPSISIGGRSRPIDVHVDGVTPCAATSEGSIRANVFARADLGEVVLEIPLPTGATPEDVRDIRQGLRDLGHELSRRVASVRRAEHQEQPRPNKPAVRRSARVFFVSEILWATTGAVGTAGLIMLLGGVTQPCCREQGWTIAGTSVLLFGAAMPFLGALVTSLVAAGMYAREGD